MNRDLFPREGLAGRLENAIPRWQGRPDSEHEQAIIRLLVGTVAAIYLVSAIIGQGFDLLANKTIYGILAFFISGGVIVIWLLIDPGISKPRRLLGMVTDIAGATMALYLNGQLATPLFIVYLWVTFGNGFRFGREYLYCSMILSLIGYGWVIVSSPSWRLSPEVTYGLLVGLLVLPMYVAALLGRLTGTLAKLERANNAKSTFLAVMSHEIRTPLNGILGLISLIRKTELNSRQSHYVQLIEKSSEWLHRVISDGLDFSKVEADELIFETSPFSLHQLLAELASFYKGVAEEKSISFTDAIDSRLPACVAGDKAKLTQVLNNLLANACKFTEKGGVRLLVELAHADRVSATVAFTISDTGIGIEPGEMTDIFQPFRQADSSTTRKFGGTGLGLTIADRIVRLMGGAIHVDSRQGEGAVFSFTLKFPLADFLNETDSHGGREEHPPTWLRAPRVLLVEDNEINREVFGQLLEVAGCAVGVAENGEQAIARARTETWDLVLMDCQMPVVDGYEATRQIRSQDFSGSGAFPIIALTAHATVADKKQCIAAGMNDYLGKPCTLRDLISMLKKWLPSLLAESGGAVPVGRGDTCPAPVVPDRNEQLPEEAARRQELHDLRNHFTKIIGSAELALLKFDSPDEVRKYLQMILQETRKETARLRKGK